MLIPELLKLVVLKAILVRQQVRQAELTPDQVVRERIVTQILGLLAAVEAKPVLRQVIHNQNQLPVTMKHIVQNLLTIKAHPVEVHQEATELLLQQNQAAVAAVIKALHREAVEVAVVTGVAAVVLQEVQGV